MKHYIKIEEVRSMVVEVEADSLEQAIALTEEVYYNDSNACLDYPRYIDGEPKFLDVTEQADLYEASLIIE